MSGYTTPPGVDERIVQIPAGELKDTLERQGMHLENWNGFKILKGGNAGQYSAYFLNEIQKKRTNEESVIIVVTAMPGKGKTYAALRFAELLDPDFDEDLQVVFEKSEFLHLTGGDSPLKRGQVIILDEAHYAAGARSWFDDIQKMLMNNIAGMRSIGLIVIVVALHLEQLDKVLRKFVLSYMFHMERRGLTTLYSLYTQRFDPELHKNRLGQMSLRLPGVEGCGYKSCLSCEWSGVVQKDWARREKWEEMGFKLCMSIRAKYERNKKNFMAIQSQIARDAIKAKELKENPIDEKDYADMIMDGYKDKLFFNKQRGPDKTAVKEILRILGHRVGSTKISEIQGALKFHYKDELEELRIAQEASKTS